MAARQTYGYHSAEQQIPVPLLGGSISNFTPAYSPLRHHLVGTATWGKNLSYSVTAWGFCPACRAKPAASRYTRNFFARRARSLFFGSMPRTASRIIQSDLDSRNRLAGTSFNPPGYPLCE